MIKHNEMLKSVVSANWPFHETIEYKTVEETEKLKKKGDTDHAVLGIYYFTKRDGWTGTAALEHPEYAQQYTYSYSFPHMMIYSDKLISKFREFEAILSLANLEDMDFKSAIKTDPIFECNLYSFGLREYDLLSALNFITWYVNEAESAPAKKYSEAYTENASQLKTKTLAIPKSYFIDDYMGKSLDVIIHPDEVGSYYAYPFEVMDDEAFADLIMQKKPGYAYLILRIGPLHNDNTYYSPVIMDAETGKVLLVSRPTDKKYNKQYSFMIKDHFEAIASLVGN